MKKKTSEFTLEMFSLMVKNANHFRTSMEAILVGMIIGIKMQAMIGNNESYACGRRLRRRLRWKKMGNVGEFMVNLKHDFETLIQVLEIFQPALSYYFKLKNTYK
jgi:hypothetical protein